MFNPWQSVKVQNSESEFFGRAGIVLRSEAGGVQVQLDDTADGKPKVVKAFTEVELQVLQP